MANSHERKKEISEKHEGVLDPKSDQFVEAMIDDDLPGTRLKNLRHEYFCQLFATSREFFGNGLQAYAEAYGKDLSDPRQYATARTNSSNLLMDADILARVDQLIEAGGLNDQHVDKQLYLLVTQNADFKAKGVGIAEYNKLKKRITDKLEITHKMSLVDLLNDMRDNPSKYELDDEDEDSVTA